MYTRIFKVNFPLCALCMFDLIAFMASSKTIQGTITH